MSLMARKKLWLIVSSVLPVFLGGLVGSAVEAKRTQAELRKIVVDQLGRVSRVIYDASFALQSCRAWSTRHPRNQRV